MKVFFSFVSLTILLSLGVESAQPMKRVDNKNSNLAVMLAYRPNSEIRTRDKSNNKSWTYEIDNHNESAEIVNEQLLEALIQDRFAKRFMVDDKKFAKRENAKDEYLESHESHDIDDAKIVEVQNDNDDKKTCYKNTYKNVLNAFESALKSQIENYKKCVCQKKTTSPTTTTTTTEASTPAAKEREDDPKLSLGNEDTLISALNNRDDIICFHKQHAFMLSKILERIPCKEKRVSEPVDQTDMKEFNGKAVKRAGRNNNDFTQKHQDLEAESESVEIDVSEMTPKPVKAAVINANKKSDENDSLNEKILALLKEHLSSSKNGKSIAKKPQEVQASPRKIKIRPRQVVKVEESEETEVVEESEEISQQEFMEQLQELFHKYQPQSDETFPLQSGEHSTESTPRVHSRKSSKKSKSKNTDAESRNVDVGSRNADVGSRNAVAESSDESTEAVVKLKNRKLETERLQLSKNARKTASTSNRINSIDDNSIDSNPKKSYRNSPRSTSSGTTSTVRSSTSRTSTTRSNLSRTSGRSTTSRAPARTDDETSDSVEEQNVQRNNAKNSKKVSKTSRPSFDDRLAADFAKKISDFARGKAPKQD